MNDRVPTVELRIEALVLRGFGDVNPAWVAIVVQRELTRLLAEEGVPPSWGLGTVPARVARAALEVEAGVSADALGTRIARSLHGVLVGESA
ncbi:MAG: hypothetical protein PVI57_14405 [Gemmatimonadota bacterium]